MWENEKHEQPLLPVQYASRGKRNMSEKVQNEDTANLANCIKKKIKALKISTISCST